MAYRTPAETPWPAITGYLSWCRDNGLADTTTYNTWCQLARFARRLDPKPIELATEDDLARYLSRAGHPASRPAPNTRSVEWSRFAAFYKWCVATGLRPDNPCNSVAKPRRRRSLPRPIAEGDLLIAIELANPEMRAMLRLAAYAGMRASEIARLRGEDILIGQRRIIVAQGKGGHPGILPLQNTVLDALTRHGLPTAGWVFPHPRLDDHHITEPAVSQRARRYLRSIGIDATLHQLRHRFGTQVYATSGHDIRVTQELLRHASPDTTAIYAWVSAADGEAAVDRLP